MRLEPLRAHASRLLRTGAAVALAGGSCCDFSWAAQQNTLDGVYTAAQAAEGARLYAERCSECHRESLAGGVNESPPLKGERFLSAWTDKPLRALYGRILSTMPQSDPGSLTEHETIAILAFLLQRNGFPASSGNTLRYSMLNDTRVSSPRRAR